MKNRPKIILKISEALKVLDPITSKDLIEELKTYPSSYWLVEGDTPKEDGTAHLFILEDTEENNRMLLQHTPIDLK